MLNNRNGCTIGLREVFSNECCCCGSDVIVVVVCFTVEYVFDFRVVGQKIICYGEEDYRTGKADFDVGDVLYAIGLEYLFGIVMLRDRFKLFFKFRLGLEIVRECR